MGRSRSTTLGPFRIGRAAAARGFNPSAWDFNRAMATAGPSRATGKRSCASGIGTAAAAASQQILERVTAEIPQPPLPRQDAAEDHP
jgi:hypothetical protein